MSMSGERKPGIFRAEALGIIIANIAAGCLTEADLSLVTQLLIKELLPFHIAGVNQSTEWVAAILAAGCLGDDHLWQDLGLTNREDLSEMIKRHFPGLYFKNTGNMKWKKFFYKSLASSGPKHWA